MIYGFHTATNYEKTKNALRGCINDYINIKDSISKQFTIENKNSVALLGHDYTYDNIKTMASKFPKIMNSGDILLYTNSSHGTQVRDNSKDETDGKDEAICPEDMKMITDDDINAFLTQFSKGCLIVGIFDNCFSGTIERGLKPIYRTILNMDANIVIFSGCGEQQTSADAYIDGKYQGALTYCLISVLQKYKYQITNLDLLNETNLMLKRGRYTQIAELACTPDMENKLFMTM